MASQPSEQNMNFLNHLEEEMTRIVDIGTESRVYRVLDTRDREVKALKVYFKTRSEDAFQYEVYLYKNKIKDHNNLVKYMGSYLNRDLIAEHLLLIEFCEGGNLRKVVEEYKRRNILIEPDLRNRWLRELISGIAYLHSLDLVHNDIHPKNIMLKNGQIKIGDFRYLKEVNKGGHTKPRGSLRYVSPERIAYLMSPYPPENQGNYPETATDIWSYGCIIYEVVTLRKLFREKDLELLTVILNSNQENIPLINSGHPLLDEIFLRTLSRDPNNRPSAADILRMQ